MINFIVRYLFPKNALTCFIVLFGLVVLASLFI